MVYFFLSLVSLLLCASGAFASFNSTYLLRHSGLKVCSPQAKLVETNGTTSATKLMSVTFGKCVFENMIFYENDTINTRGDFAQYSWNASQECEGETFDFAHLHCHHANLSSWLENVGRREDRCYLDIGTKATGKKCVYEKRGNWSLLDWMFPVVIVLAVFGFTCCCCLKNRIRKSSNPRGPILDTEPEHPDAPYNDRDSPFQ